MSYMTENELWNEFWGKREDGLNEKQMVPFTKNWIVMEDIMHDYFGTYDFKGMETCEVGAGRGTMSDILNAKGAITHCCDLRDRLKHSNHYFEICDIKTETPFDKGNGFDLVFTYGLLEHFTEEWRWCTMMKMEDMLKPGGMFIHYVVPKKWTNIFEDRSVPRYACNEWRDGTPQYKIGIKPVFPVWNMGSWICDEVWSKGFFVYKTKESNEGTSFSNSKE